MKRLYLGLALALFFVPLSADRAASAPLLKVAFLSVGQGDAIYIEAPNGNQMIIDGGPSGSLTGPLSSVMPFGDRSINVIMVTNPDTDHYAGYLDLLETYDVGAVIEPGTRTSTPTHAELQKMIGDKKIPELVARRGMTIDLDTENKVTFTVLFPDRDVSAWSTNDGSITGILEYGKTRIMFTGDSTKRTEAVVLAENEKGSLASDILKVAHHGSTTSSSEEFLSAVMPKYAVISAGAHNSYGLPKQITLDALKAHGIETVRTDEEGTIIFTSDGASYSRVIKNTF